MKAQAAVVLFIMMILSIGCSGEGVFENPDSVEVTTLEAMHGSQGHQLKFHIGPNDRLGQKDAGITKQVILKLHDPEVTTATIYVIIETNSISIGGIVYLMKSATDVAIVPTLPEGTEPLTRMVLTSGGPGGDPFAGYLRITPPMPSEPVFVSWRGTITQESKEWYLRELRKPPEVIHIPPAAVDSITYYRDPDLTEPFTDSVLAGETIYTRVALTKPVPVVIADDASARPQLLAFIGPKWLQFRIKPRGTDLQDGDAKLYQNTDHIFVCKYVTQTIDVGTEFFADAYVGNDSAAGDPLKITFYVYTDPGTGNEPMLIAQNPQDFLGQVLFPKLGVGISPRSNAKPIADVTVTIMAGPRASESTITNRHGQYLFSNVAGDTLHLRVEREHFEPKEVIVHRYQPTILANGTVPNFPQDPQKNPGTILIGRRWPDEIRFILRETLLVYDLLYIDGDYLSEVRNSYTQGVVTVHSRASIFNTFAHEIAHAHQHAAVSLDGSGDIGDWINTLEGRAFAEAREKDWAVFGRVGYDTLPYFSSSSLESAAETCAYWWSTGQPWELESYQEIAAASPNRFKWAEEWLRKR